MSRSDERVRAAQGFPTVVSAIAETSQISQRLGEDLGLTRSVSGGGLGGDTRPMIVPNECTLTPPLFRMFYWLATMIAL